MGTGPEPDDGAAWVAGSVDSKGAGVWPPLSAIG